MERWKIVGCYECHHTDKYQNASVATKNSKFFHNEIISRASDTVHSMQKVVRKNFKFLIMFLDQVIIIILEDEIMHLLDLYLYVKK